MASSLIKDYYLSGTAAARPAAPVGNLTALFFYYATDTGVTSVYANGGWHTF